MGNGRQDTGKRPAHLVWDWNGTLLDDIVAVIEATNAAFAQLGMEPITLERYRELYCVPVPRFYQRLMGRLPTDAEWLVMDEAFHEQYWARADACGLTEGAAELLAARWAAGLSQSLLSMAPHEHLVPIVRRHGITDHFLRVDGRTGPSHGSKAEHMVRHLTALRAADPGDIRRADRGDRGRGGRRGGGGRRGCAGGAVHRRLPQPGQPRGRRASRSSTPSRRRWPSRRNWSAERELRLSGGGATSPAPSPAAP